MLCAEWYTIISMQMPESLPTPDFDRLLRDAVMAMYNVKPDEPINRDPNSLTLAYDPALQEQWSVNRPSYRYGDVTAFGYTTQTDQRIKLARFPWAGMYFSLCHERGSETTQCLAEVNNHLGQIAMAVEVPYGQRTPGNTLLEVRVNNPTTIPRIIHEAQRRIVGTHNTNVHPRVGGELPGDTRNRLLTASQQLLNLLQISGAPTEPTVMTARELDATRHFLNRIFLDRIRSV